MDNILIMGLPQVEDIKNETEKIFAALMFENFSNQQTQNYIPRKLGDIKKEK